MCHKDLSKSFIFGGNFCISIVNRYVISCFKSWIIFIENDCQIICQSLSFKFLFADGPILVHTTFGDLLRSLDTPEKMNSPTNLALSREGFVVANFPGGHVVAFTANGNRLRHEIHNDHIQVCCEIFLYLPVFCLISRKFCFSYFSVWWCLEMVNIYLLEETEELSKFGVPSI